MSVIENTNMMAVAQENKTKIISELKDARKDAAGHKGGFRGQRYAVLLYADGEVETLLLQPNESACAVLDGEAMYLAHYYTDCKRQPKVDFNEIIETALDVSGL